ncbi:hypothetical protein FOMPIDRAFT_88096 [Fomitopsis schrenkii]|uniref:Uncharacterized protein n=1 Tax=Fomitopsis schrenkii TaxID=2126942 RepID=S8EBI8_FOMSC|nr:hypothetical protein FOMPIDRAFT_88096 [Fomitopsis schrenkii]
MLCPLLAVLGHDQYLATAPGSEEVSPQWDDPLSSDAAGNLIFNSLVPLMQRKSNSRYRVGHSIVWATIPPGKLLYHGRGDSGYPYMDWLAIDPEHSRIFARGSSATQRAESMRYAGYCKASF